jgi:HTH-type transcriptional regulator/antitoxin HigA
MAYKLSQSSTSSSTRNTIAAGGRRTAKRRINPKRYGALLADTLPRVIETPEELARLAGRIEPLLDKAGRRTAEEEELCRLVLKLIDDYQRERQLIPSLKPHELLQALLEESGKRQIDLLPVFGSRSRVSDAVNGKREISKAQAKRLGQLFHLSPAAFI